VFIKKVVANFMLYKNAIRWFVFKVLFKRYTPNTGRMYNVLTEIDFVQD